MEQKYVFIGIFAVLAITVLAFLGISGITGKSSGYYCVDSDKDPSLEVQKFKSGFVQGTNRNGESFTQRDICSLDPDNYVVEYTCAELVDSGYAKNMVECPNGCIDGACVQPIIY